MAGRNNRYNNVQIDGAVNNDVFGLAPSGTRAASTEAQPITSTRSRSCSWSSRPTTCVRAASRAAASTPSRRPAPTSLRDRVLLRAATRTGSVKNAHRHEDRRLQGPAVRRQPRRTAGREQGVLLRQRRLGAQEPAPSGVFDLAGIGQQFGQSGGVSASSTSCRRRYDYDPGALATSSAGRSTATRCSSAPTSTSATTRRPAQLRRSAATTSADPTVSATTCRTTSTETDTTNSTVVQLNSTLGTIGQRAPLHLPARSATPAASRARTVRVPGVTVDLTGTNVVAARELLGAPTSWIRTSSSSPTTSRAAASTRSRSAPTTSSSSSGTSSSATTSATTGSTASGSA